MRKLFTTALLLMATIVANAQLSVSSNGQVTVGDGSIYAVDRTGSDLQKIGVLPSLLTDTTSNLKIMGSNKGHGGTISFGDSRHVYINEIYEGSQSSSNKNGILRLEGRGGLRYTCGSKTIVQYEPGLRVVGASEAPLHIYKPVSAPQYLTSSDANLKSNIKPLENMGDLLADITPVSYTLKSTTNDEVAQKDGMFSQSVDQRHLQYGFIAQEVREIYPDLVYEDSDGLLSIDYTGFIPLLVDAMKDMKATIQEQQAEIESLKNPVQGKPIGSDAGAVVASLSQNKPNPFKVTTTVACVIPENVSTAFLCVYDLNGSQKLRRDIKQRGNVDVTIEGNSLTAGMYIYTLVCDGQEIDSKRMILTD